MSTFDLSIEDRREEVQSMTLVTEMTAFEQYAARRLPPELRPDAGVPPTWDASAVEWEAVRQAAEAVLRDQYAKDFAIGIAVRGLRPVEMTTDELDPGSSIVAATGEVRRPPAPTVTATLQSAARQALRELERRRLSLDAALQQRLEMAAFGRWQGDEKPVKAAIDAAEVTVRQHDAERQVAQAAADARPVLIVHRPFRATGGKSYAVGRYPVDPAVAAELQDWQGRMEATAKARRWSHPEGDGRHTVWPPFTLEGPTD